MPTDKRISELNNAGTLISTDKFAIDRVGGAESLGGTIDGILNYMFANLAVGAKITFVTAIPSNVTGANGDIAWKDNGEIYQKVAGTWTIRYTIPAYSAADGTVLYFNGTPPSDQGKDGDTAINALAGIFYQKISGAWGQRYSVGAISSFAAAIAAAPIYDSDSEASSLAPNTLYKTSTGELRYKLSIPPDNAFNYTLNFTFLS